MNINCSFCKNPIKLPKRKLSILDEMNISGLSIIGENDRLKLRKFRSDISSEINICTDRTRIKSLKKYVKASTILIEYYEGTYKSRFIPEFPIELNSRFGDILYGLEFGTDIVAYTYSGTDEIPIDKVN